MRLPNVDQAIVAEEKVTQYLLNPLHPDGAGKAKFFESVGFSRLDWRVLSYALLRLAETVEVRLSVESAHGWKYIVEGPLATPGGRTPRVRTVWIVDHGLTAPRLVTAYPL